VSATGSAFVNLFIEQNADDSAFKNLRIVNGRFISDKTSNIAFIGGNLGVGVNSPQETLDIRGNMHFNRVSNVSQISVDSNVVTEYTGPHDRPLRKYPEVAMTSASQGGYTVTRSNSHESAGYYAYEAFNGITNTADDIWYSTSLSHYNTSDGSAATSGSDIAPRLDTNTDYGEWIALEIPKPIKLDSFKLWRQNNWQHHHPVSATLYAKKTSSDSWTEIYRYDDIDVRQGDAPGHFNVNSQVFYSFFAFVARKRSGGASNGPTDGISLAELEYYGHEEGSGSLDTTLKSVYNVPATTGTQLEVYYDAKDLTTMPATVSDLAGGDQNGTPYNVTLDSTTKSFVFNGSSSYINSGTTPISGNQHHSFSCWLKPTSGNTNYRGIGYIFQSGSNNTTTGLFLKDGKPVFLTWGTNFEPDYTLPENEWVHVTAVYDGTGRTIYINSKTIGSDTYSSYNINASANLYIGASSATPGEVYNGSIANFRLYSKALNADQVKELYDYQKDYFLGSKSQVTLYKGHLGVGVTEPSGQLELAGDERIQEYPPGPMSGYETLVEGHGVFCAYAPNESTNSNNPFAWKAFNKETSGSKWWFEHDSAPAYQYGTSSDTSQYANPANIPYTTNGIVGLYIELKFPYAINLKSYALTARNTDALIGRRMPEEGVLFGSNDDGTTWTAIHNHKDTGGNYTTGIGPRNFSVNVKSMYSYFRLVTTKLFDRSGGGGTSGETPNIGELQFFGTPGPTTLDKGSLSLTRSLDVPRISRYDVDTETPRPEKLLVDFDTTVNSSPTDISGKGNHGTLVGATYSSADKAFSFDGSTDYIKGNLNNTGDTDFTVSLWLKKNTSGTVGMLWNFGGSGGSGNPEDSVALEVGANNNLDYFIFSGALGAISNFGTTYLNRWVHIVATRSGNNLKIYLDGVDQNMSTTGTDTLQLAANTEYTIGARGTGSLGNNSLNGYISNFKVYDVVLEPSEVKKLYNLGRTGRSMVISDTAVGIGKVPEAQLDVRGTGKFTGAMTVQGQARLTDFVAMGSGTNSTTRLFVDDPITVKTWNAFNNNSSAGEYTFEARATTLVHFHYSAGEDVNISESYLVTCADNGSPTVVQLKTAGYLYYSTGHGSRVVRFRADALPGSYNSSNFHLRISAIWKVS
jgi:hypothetical protein